MKAWQRDANTPNEARVLAHFRPAEVDYERSERLGQGQ